jgi:hypothetical protein
VRMHAHTHSLSLSHSHSHSLTHSLLPSSSLMQPPDRPFPPVDPANVSMSLFLPSRGARCGRITCVVWWCGRQCPSLILRHLRSHLLNCYHAISSFLFSISHPLDPCRFLPFISRGVSSFRCPSPHRCILRHNCSVQSTYFGY